MSVDTRAYLQNQIEPEEIAQFLNAHYGVDLNDIKITEKRFSKIILSPELRNILVNNYSDNQNFWCSENCLITFLTPQGNYRTIFWAFDACVFTEAEVFRKQSNNPFTYISMHKDEQGINIIKSITAYFGGYFDEDDCDNIDYIAIPKNSSEVKNGGLNSEIKPIFYFTMEELQEYFGGFVKIVSKEEKEKLIEKKITMKKMTPPPPPEAPPLRTLIEGFKRDNN